MKFLSMSFVMLCLLSISCGPKKPAYSDIQTDRDGRAVNQNSSSQAAPAPQPPESAATGQTAPQPAQASAKPEPFKVPEFFDMNVGQIKDLPSYPRATRVSVQYGPLQGTQSAMIILQTGDPLDKIAAFYERAIKTNGWKVVSDQRDKDVMKIEVNKGERDEGLIRVLKDEKTGLVNIGLSRIEKPAQSNQ
ncbi:MAG TPA: hypothetical protein VFQ92_15825 [Blastocatellia bacterium]|nr:hypothetical protein [Blastocatellia bacterium]